MLAGHNLKLELSPALDLEADRKSRRRDAGAGAVAGCWCKHQSRLQSVLFHDTPPFCTTVATKPRHTSSRSVPRQVV
ncbi:hypothetical protein B7463_g12273, partial [Scytalidium lignicola]